jgi:uncharacterized protein (DUF3084 family)
MDTPTNHSAGWSLSESAKALLDKVGVNEVQLNGLIDGLTRDQTIFDDMVAQVNTERNKIVSMQKQVTTLESQLSEKEHQAQALRTSQLDAQQKNAKLSAENIELKNKVQELRLQTQVIPQLKSRISTLESENGELNIKVNNRQVSLEDVYQILRAFVPESERGKIYSSQNPKIIDFGVTSVNATTKQAIDGFGVRILRNNSTDFRVMGRTYCRNSRSITQGNTAYGTQSR